MSPELLSRFWRPAPLDYAARAREAAAAAPAARRLGLAGPALARALALAGPQGRRAVSRRQPDRQPRSRHPRAPGAAGVRRRPVAASLLFVGCGRYTRHYAALFAPATERFRTLDIDPRRARFGNAGHLVAALQDVARTSHRRASTRSSATASTASASTSARSSPRRCTPRARCFAPAAGSCSAGTTSPPSRRSIRSRSRSPPASFAMRPCSAPGGWHRHADPSHLRHLRARPGALSGRAQRIGSRLMRRESARRPPATPSPPSRSARASRRAATAIRPSPPWARSARPSA